MGLLLLLHCQRLMDFRSLLQYWMKDIINETSTSMKYFDSCEFEKKLSFVNVRKQGETAIVI